MARTRIIKPGFFLNEHLGTCDPLAALLFIGLWTLADSAGRLEFRPMWIKAQVFPYREMTAREISGLIAKLREYGFLTVYEVEKTPFIEIKNFVEHQKPHKNEKQSIIPEPKKNNVISMSCKNSGKIGNAREITRDSLDVLGFDVRCLMSDENIMSTAQKLNKSISSCDLKPDQNSTEQKTTGPDPEAIREIFTELCPALPQPKKITDRRKREIAKRCHENPEAQSTEFWRAFFCRVTASDFLTGRSTDFSASFDWLINKSNFQKVIEGNYDNRKKQNGISDDYIFGDKRNDW